MNGYAHPMTVADIIKDSVNEVNDKNLKWCGCCQQMLILDFFAKNSAKKDGLQERCTKCRKEHNKKYKHLRKKPEAHQKRKWLLAKYKLDLTAYENMLEKQNNVCAICKSNDWGRPSPSVDHCHTTGLVRGLLCNSCNRALGLFKDNAEVLTNAANYIKRFS